MWGQFNVGESYATSRPPTIVRIEVDLVNRRVTAVWEFLQISKEAAFSLERLSENDALDVFSAAQAAIEALEQVDPPYRFVDGDTVEVWQILGEGEPRLLATAEVSVTALICSECALKRSPYEERDRGTD